MTILDQYPFTVKQYGDQYGNPVAIARQSIGLDEKTIHIFGDQTVRYSLNGDDATFAYTPDMLGVIKHEVRALFAACGWPEPRHDMMTGAEWQWLVIKHARGIL